MRFLALCYSLLLFVCVNVQNLYHPDSIRTVEIFFSEPNWDYLLDSMATALVGTGTGQTLVPTFAANNSQFVSVSEQSSTSAIKVYPNPSKGGFWLETSANGVHDLRIINTQGRLVEALVFSGNRIWLDLEQQANGLFFVQVDGQVVRLVKR